jgi:hypothetical protein
MQFLLYFPSFFLTLIKKLGKLEGIEGDIRSQTSKFFLRGKKKKEENNASKEFY